MFYGIKTIKTLISDNGKRFHIGDCITFSIYNTIMKKEDKYISNIIDINNDSIIIDNIEINKQKFNGKAFIKLSDILTNSCDYVYYD